MRIPRGFQSGYVVWVLSSICKSGRKFYFLQVWHGSGRTAARQKKQLRSSAARFRMWFILIFRILKSSVLSLWSRKWNQHRAAIRVRQEHHWKSLFHKQKLFLEKLFQKYVLFSQNHHRFIQFLSQLPHRIFSEQTLKPAHDGRCFQVPLSLFHLEASLFCKYLQNTIFCLKKKEERLVIEVNNLVKRYGDHTAVDHLSLKLRKAKSTAFWGQTELVNLRLWIWLPVI